MFKSKISIIAAIVLFISVFTISLVAGLVYFSKDEDKNQNNNQSSTPTPTNQPEPEQISHTKVAFIGDQGYTNNSLRVLELIKAEDTDIVIHAGDFDYIDNPQVWWQRITEVFGPNYPYLFVVGNHDIAKWPEYQKLLIDRIDNIKTLNCTDEIGVKSICELGGLKFAFTSPGVMGDIEEYPSYVEQNLTSDSDWELCVFHKNQHNMQTGSKKDETGWGIYEACKNTGAMIITGHEHAYARTHVLSDFENQTIVSTDSVVIDEGQTFATVNGIAGHSIRPRNNEVNSQPWWAKVYTSDVDAVFGALFCNFEITNINRDTEAECYFKNVDNGVVDQFTVINKAN